MYCRNCGAEMNENQEVCLKCGVPKNAGKKFCPNCGTEIANELQAVCLNCGVKLESEQAQNSSSDWEKPQEKLGGQSKLVMALICFFLGEIGVHNFMMGETKKGIFKIIMTFCFGLSCIFALIDLIKILCDKYTADPTKLV